MRLPAASVIVPVYNGTQYLREQFDRMMRQDFAEPWELIYVDNGSTDGSREMIRGFQASGVVRLRLVEADGARGQVHARNAGAKAARSEWLLFTDQDDLPSSRWLTELRGALDHHRSAGGHVQVTAAGVEPVGTSVDPTPDTLPTLFGGFEIAFGTNFAVRKETLAKVGGWQDLDPDLRAGEDTDLCIRLKLEGIGIAYVPRARVVWRSKQTFRAVWSQGVSYGRSEVLAYQRYRARGATSPGLRGALNTWIFAFGRFLKIPFGRPHQFMGAIHGLAWAVGRTRESFRSKAWFI